MAKPVLMPKQGITVESCILTEWKVKVGDVVKKGDILFAYETDKSSFEQESEFDGEVLAILAENGEEVPVLNNVCVIGAKGEDISAFVGGATPAPAVESAPAPAPVASAPVAPATPAVATNAKGVMMPKQGITVESCILTEWKVKVGDKVKKGDVLFAYETDKASFEQESEFDGEVLALLAENGEEVPVLNNVCVIGEKGDDISCFLSGSAPAPVAVESAPAPTAPATTAPANTASAPVQNAEGKIFASPRAKALAEKMGVDLKKAVPTGPKGRIVEADVRVASLVKEEVQEVVAPAVEAKADAPVDFKAFKDEKMPNIRKVIAKSMVASLSTMAQLTHTLSFDCTNILAFRAYLKANAEKLNIPNVTINDIIIYAVSRVIKNHRDLNANLINGDTMRYFEHVNMGIATDTPRGLLVPVLAGADTMSLVEISQNAKKLAKAAQGGSISPELMQGGSFTISNLGIMGIESFTPVINPPQTGILGVNGMETRIKLGKNGEVVPYSAMALSLTYDHRALDGAPASRFLKELKEYLENFSLNLLAEKKALI